MIMLCRRISLKDGILGAEKNEISSLNGVEKKGLDSGMRSFSYYHI